MNETEQLRAASQATEILRRVNTALQTTQRSFQTATSAAGQLLNASAWKTGGKAMEGTAAALNRVAKSTAAVAKAQRTLFGFDQITKIPLTSGGSSGKSSGRKSGGTSKKSGTSGRVVGEVSAMSSKVGQILDRMWGKIRTQAAKEVNFSGLSKGFQAAQAAAQPFSDQMTGSLSWGYRNVLLPLAGWVLPATGPNALGNMTGAVRALTQGLDGVRPFGQTVWEGLLRPMGLWNGGTLISGLSGATSAFGGLSGALAVLPGNWETLRGRTASIWSGIRTAMVDNASGASNGVLSLFSQMSTGAAGHGETLKQKLSKLSGQIVTDTQKGLGGVNNALKTPFKNGFNGVLELLNQTIKKINSSMHLSWPAVKVAGKTVAGAGSVTLAKLSAVSKLAQGGIAEGPAFSLIGEAGREAVLPLERNTEWMDRLADRIAGRMGRGGETVIQVNVGSERLVRQVVQGVNDVTRRTGHCPIYV